MFLEGFAPMHQIMIIIEHLKPILFVISFSVVKILRNKQMEKDVERLSEHIKNKEYSKILQLLKYIRKHRLEFNDKDVEKLFREQESILKMILTNDIQFLLFNGRKISPEIIDTVTYCDLDFQQYIKDKAVECIVNNHTEEFQLESLKLKSLKSIQQCYVWFDRRILEIGQKYTFLPECWNFYDHLVSLFFKKVSEALKDNRIEIYQDEKSFVESIEASICFESKYNKNNILEISGTKTLNKEEDKCILFEDKDVKFFEKKDKKLQDSINSSLSNKKTISLQILSHNPDLYIKYLCNEFKTFKYEKEKHDVQIIKCFIEFFSTLKKVYKKILYFENIGFVKVFLERCDKCLAFYLKNLNTSEVYPEELILLNTILFIEKTFNDFILYVNMSWGFQVSANFLSLEVIRILENKHFENLGYKLSKFLYEMNLNFFGNFSKDFISFLNTKILTFDPAYIYPDLIDFIFAAIFSKLFSKISKIKMNVEKAEHILEEINEIKENLKKIKGKIPGLSTLQKYLKIYLVPFYDVDNFVDNFILISGSKFLFSQILKNLEKSENNPKLYIRYQSKIRESKNLNLFKEA